MKKYLLFDLDGTLTDPKEGICTCVQYALASFGIEEPNLDKLEPFIGPPLKNSFMEFYHMDEAQAEAAVEKYRERFRDKGIFENKLYRGIPAMLRDLRSRGMVLAVASSKPTVFVEKILEHFHIAKYFTAVVGSELDGSRANKDQVVRETLKRLFPGGPVKRDQIYMIGDRRFDVEGAHALGIESVGVTYGYGDMEEMKKAHSDYIVRSVEELHGFLIRGTEDPEGMSPFQKVWRVLFPFLLFYLVRGIVSDLLVLGAGFLGGVTEAGFLLARDQEGMITGFTGNGAAILSALGFLAGGASIFGLARRAVKAAGEDMRLRHLREEPGSSYLFLGLAALGLVLGMNLLLRLSGAMGLSEGYQAVAQTQFGAWLPVGLVCYGFVSPVAEELLFRGILFSHLRRFGGPLWGIGLSALLFGIYHGNLVQGIYALVIGCLLAYAYEYFGDFRLTILLHMLANVLVYVMSFGRIGQTAFVSWPVCIACLLCAMAGLGMLWRRKRVL